MSTLSRLRSLWVLTLWVSTSTGCAEAPSNSMLPKSALETETWLQTSHKIRYAFDTHTQWQGWVLHSSTPERIAIALFPGKTLPSSSQWHDCIRTRSQPPSLWLSANVDSLAVTKRYAHRINDTLPIVEVQC